MILDGRQTVNKFRLFGCIRFLFVEVPDLLPFLCITDAGHTVIVNGIAEISIRSIRWIGQPCIELIASLLQTVRQSDGTSKVQNCCT